MREGWEYKKLGDICDIYQPKTISAKELVENGNYLVYGANGVIGRYNSYNHINSEVLMTCRGATCGTINVSKPYSWINGNAMVIHPKNNRITQAFLSYHLKGIDLSDVITGAAQPQITRQSLSPKKVFIPPLAEQEKIVAELDLLSNIIEKKKAQLEEYDQLAQSIFYDMFGDPVTNEKGWEVKKMGEIGTFQRGSGFLKSDFVENGVPCIHYGQIHMKFGPFIYQHLTEIPKEVAAKSKIASRGDVIIAITSEDIEGSCKCTAWLGDYDVYVGAHAAIFKHNLNPIYVSYYIGASEFQREKQKYVHGIKVMEIKPSDIEKINILLPPLSLQQEFANKTEAIERQKELIKQSIAETETLFNSRMDYYFN